jgi:hypothetical protein
MSPTSETHAGARPVPVWLRAGGALALVAIGAAMAYAVAIGIANYGRIGV